MYAVMWGLYVYYSGRTVGHTYAVWWAELLTGIYQ